MTPKFIHSKLSGSGEKACQSVCVRTAVVFAVKVGYSQLKS
jgi:hypothetical protein